MPDTQSQVQQWKKDVFQQSINDYDKLDERYFQVITQLSKTIITLSAGTLAFSMTFLTNIIKQPTSLTLLKWSWFLFGFTIMLVILESFLSGKAIKKQIDINKAYYQMFLELEDSRLNTPEKNPYGKWLTILNIVIGFTFTASFLFLGLFVISNL